VPSETGSNPCGMPAPEEAGARAHIASAAERQRAARGTIEFVSKPWLRQRGRQLLLAWTWAAKVSGATWRRLADSRKLPGRWVGRVKLWRITETLSKWVVLWAVLSVVCFVLVLEAGEDSPERWFANWGLAGSLSALLAVLWHDLIKSPRTVRQVRRRIATEPEALLRTTLARQTTKVVELDPPLDTVPRDDLYDELLPGALARKKDVQIVVGDPGAGKTTALLDLASVLAKVGLVPVLLELRGEQTSDDLFDLARRRFEQQVRPFVRTDADAEIVWRWLGRRRRVAILVDDIDQIGFDGEPGFVMRRLLENVATEGQAVIVTARPAGVPMGIAASAIAMDPLDFDTAVDLAAKPVLSDPGTASSVPPPREEIERWVQEGELTEAPLYLEALAELTSVGACPDLPDDPEYWSATERPGRWQARSEARREWSPAWVRYMLLDRFYAGIVRGDVRRSLAIDESDRRRSIKALEGAALGTLGASGREAAAAAIHSDRPEVLRPGRPKRKNLADFISPDDRSGLDREGDGALRRRPEVSQHEAIDTCQRLRILEADWRGYPQFRHRIMQAFLAARQLAELGRAEREDGRLKDAAGRKIEDPIDCFDAWVRTLMDSHHPEKLTAHLTLVLAAIHADERSLRDPGRHWDVPARHIVKRLIESVGRDHQQDETGDASHKFETQRLITQLDPTKAPDPHQRTDPDDDLIKLTTAATLVSLLRKIDDKKFINCRNRITELVRTTSGAMRWTKLQAVPSIAALGGAEAWLTLWQHFTRDPDYDVRRAASKQLEINAWHAYSELWQPIECHILYAGGRAAKAKPLQIDSEQRNWSREAFVALGWVLPAIVSGLSEKLRVSGQLTGAASAPVDETEATATVPAPWQKPETHEECLTKARDQLIKFATLAYEGNRPELEDSLAQGFKADAMRHAAEARELRGAGWVASNRRLVADIGLPHAESWYARMLLYQALALYAISGTNQTDTLDMLTNRLHRTRERHPLARQAAKLSRIAVRHARFKGARWKAFIWSDDVEDAGRLPSVLSHKTAQLVGDVAVLVDLKEGSPPDRHESFGHMEELPYCLSDSRNRYEILGSGCPAHCGWGFCPYRAASPDEPNEHRGLSRGFSRGQRRLTKGWSRAPSWQRKISRRRLREFWEQMEYKARR